MGALNDRGGVVGGDWEGFANVLLPVLVPAATAGGKAPENEEAADQPPEDAAKFPGWGGICCCCDGAGG